MAARTVRRGILLAIAALALVTGGGGCGGADHGSRPASATAAAVRHDRFAYARGLFREICAGCHTLADAGTHGSRFNLDNDYLLGRPLVWHAIQDGEYGMPAWKGVLSDREVDALARYVDAVAKRRHGETGWGAETKRRLEGEPPERR
jgi:mono/diheme cytochrome c family protein